MANVRNKKTAPAPTAASGRATRAPGRKPLPKPKPKPAPKAKKARGRPKGYKAVKNRAEDGSTIKKKRRVSPPKLYKRVRPSDEGSQ